MSFADDSVWPAKKQKNQCFNIDLPQLVAVGIRRFLCYGLFTNKHGSLPDGLERFA
jgi:hypothetical protein